MKKALSFLFYQSPPIGATATKDRSFKALDYLRTPTLIVGSTNNVETNSSANVQKEIEKARKKVENFIISPLLVFPRTYHSSKNPS